MKKLNLVEKHVKRAILSALAGGTSLLVAGGALADEAPEPADDTLSEVVVLGKPPEFFRATDASSASRFDLPLQETPQSISVMTEDFLRKANIQSLEDASRFVAGVAEQGMNGWGEPRSQFRARGVAIDLFNSFKLNNYSFPFQGLLDTVGIERIEFVKGPAAIGYGLTSYGGIINIVTKKPQRESSTVAEVDHGSFGTYRIEADVTGPLSEDGRLRFRGGVGYRDGGTFREGERADLLTVVPALVFDATDELEISANGYFQNGSNVAGGSVPVLSDASGRLVLPNDDILSRDTFAGNSKYSQSDNETRAAVLKLKYQANDTTQINAVANYSEGTLDVRSAYLDAFSYPVSMDPDAADYGQMNSLTQVLIDANKAFNAEVSLQKEFEAFSRQHTLFVLGGYQDTKRSLIFAANCTGSVNVFDFETTDVPAVFTTPEDALSQSGTYCYGYSDWERIEDSNVGVQANFNLSERLNVLTGIRYDSIDEYHVVGRGLDVDTILRTGEVTDDVTVDDLTLRLGAVYELTPHFNVYGTYVDGFTPQFGRTRSGGTVDTEKGKLYEVGVKGVFRGGALATNAALFQLDTVNTEIDDPANLPGEPYVIAAGEVERWGVELETIGKLTDQLAVSVNYAYIHGEVTEAPDDPESVGEELRVGPNHSASLLLNYTFAREDQWDGLSLGGSVSYASSQLPRFFADFVIPAYTTVDVHAAYPITPKLEVRAVLSNLLDEDYVLPSGSPYGVNYGEPRAFSVSFRMAL
jgi:iron complex outermembrane receptor protein